MTGKAYNLVRWTFYGRVLPDLPTISLQLPKHRSESNLGFSFELSGHVHQSKIIAFVSQLSQVDIFTLRNAVMDDVQGSVDLACFLTGAGLDVDLTSAASDDGAWQIFDAFIPTLRSDGEISIPYELVAAVGGDVPAHIMLADFREAMRVPRQTGFFCYRAIESAMQAFKNASTTTDGEAWVAMRSALRVDEKAVRRVKVHADWARHGRPGSLTDETRVMLFHTTRSIIHRYLNFLVAGRQPLADELLE